MGKKLNIQELSRREFLKKAAILGAGLTIAPNLIIPKKANAEPWKKEEVLKDINKTFKEYHPLLVENFVRTRNDNLLFPFGPVKLFV